MSEEPYFLEMEDYHISISEAKRIVKQALFANGMNSPIGGWERSTINFPPENEPIPFMQLVESVRKTGVMPFFQFESDKNDSIFGGTFGMSTPTSGMQITSTYAGHSKTLKGPMTDQPVEYELASDIMFYREEASLFSNEYDFTFCTRYYRAYLIACISLVDAFINRHILMYEFSGLNTLDFTTLRTTSRLEDRVALFIKISTGKDLEAINSDAEWIYFKKLRVLRNEMTHINGPSLGYSIGEFADHFNYVRKGIGGLLYKIRMLQGRKTLSFIEQLKTAPLIYFNEITHKANGNHIIRRRKSDVK